MAWHFLASARPRLFISAWHQVPDLRPSLVRFFSCTLLTRGRVRYWTEDELSTLQKLLAEDKDDRHIASLLGRSRRAVEKQRLRLRRDGDLSVANRCPVQWTKQEDDRLEYLKGKGWSWELIAEDLNRSLAAVRIRFARVLGTLKPPERMPRRQWSRSDLIELKEMSNAGLTQPEMAKKLKVSYYSIVHRLASLDKPHQRRHDYTREEDQQLLNLRRQGLTWAKISASFPDRSVASVKYRYAHYLSPKGQSGSDRVFSNHGEQWTEQEKAALSDYISQGLSDEEISGRLGRSTQSIRYRRYVLEGDRKHLTGRGTEEPRSAIEVAASSGAPASAPMSSSEAQ